MLKSCPEDRGTCPLRMLFCRQGQSTSGNAKFNWVNFPPYVGRKLSAVLGACPASCAIRAQGAVRRTVLIGVDRY
eukprot:394883-Ditylum_brightwellii.AAC.1